jgi:hypothetical protein
MPVYDMSLTCSRRTIQSHDMTTRPKDAQQRNAAAASEGLQLCTGHALLTLCLTGAVCKDK